jgi:hypothetical protein
MIIIESEQSIKPMLCVVVNAYTQLRGTRHWLIINHSLTNYIRFFKLLVRGLLLLLLLNRHMNVTRFIS